MPRVMSYMTPRDWAGSAFARLGVIRDNYKVVPGLYCVGFPDEDSPVIVSANYKLTFDALRRELSGIDAWILVVDTRGINVWCAAGKNLFSSEEVARVVRAARLSEVVSHRRLILPQLAATGVGARKVKKLCGFDVVFGPVRASDLQRYFENGSEATPDMREVTFTLAERAVLIPVELVLLWKTMLTALCVAFVLSGVGPDVFSFSAAAERVGDVALALVAGVVSGAVVVPLLLPWLPGTAFSVKGLWPGVFAAAGLLTVMGMDEPMAGAALAALSVSVSSYMAMNFTGSTPFTSPSGVEREMRSAMPWQLGGLLVWAVLWVALRFAA
ncbi:hypothetical protein GGQ74_001552 [Desulfobaculum xiamenense]|uniref:CO dehydrogenase/acetyl-CoA synthase delta subunit TIM barrel domain-containing protein n=1 Tax=Desulfobaculum xiamenense TaxID=995050 RepID=A0A846QN70_9BACT|nr:hypothetical protein [Desulfobaculum xiamenense]